MAKKTLIVGDGHEPHELICKVRSFEEYRFAEDDALDPNADSNADLRGAYHGPEAMSAFQGMVGHSSALLQVLELAVRAARSNCTVLIQGETGTGKELLARGIHASSKRATKAFVTLNCGAIPKELFESELFGHLQGSFTGAVRNRTGKAEAANFGTLFLDEIGEMPLESQVKLLRLIQEGEIERVGAIAPTKLDIRIIAATNRNLPALVKKRKFREDLYHRLNVIALELPNLRERAEDIPELVHYFFERSCAKHQRDSLMLSASILDRFAAYSWPGNIRELQNAIERIVVLAPGREVELNNLPPCLQSDAAAPLARIALVLPSRGVGLHEIEKEVIREALKKNHGNRSRAARYLSITRDTFNYRMRKYGLYPATVRRMGPNRVEKSPLTALVH